MTATTRNSRTSGRRASRPERSGAAKSASHGVASSGLNSVARWTTYLLIIIALGYAQLAMDRPEDALSSFDRAGEESPFVYEAADLGEGFRAQIAEGRRRAQQQLTGK